MNVGFLRFISTQNSVRICRRGLKVLGIESSCDDTGVAIVNDKNVILGEALHNQGAIHREFGGIIPTIARDFHRDNISNIVTEALESAELSPQDLDAVAVSVEPGLTLSLKIGLNHAQKIAQEINKPIIPIHHMEAHALTARLTHEIEFPYLVLLMSGGHCLLSVVEDVNKFKLLGTCLDTSPGDMLDKTARRLRLKSLPHVTDLCGGAAIEKLAISGDPLKYPFPPIMTQRRDCNFSFAGIQVHCRKLIEQIEVQFGTGPASVIPTVSDLCASLQHTTLNHMSKRLQRAFLFCDMKGLLPQTNRTLVLSGGVASNSYIRKGLSRVAAEFECQIACPPARLCTDNGVMVAWNGMEKLQRNIDVLPNTANITVKHKSPLGESLIDEVCRASLKVQRIRTKIPEDVCFTQPT